MTPTLDAALLISSRAGADLGRTSDIFSDVDFDQLLLACHVVYSDRLLGAFVTYTLHLVTYTLYLITI